MPPLLPVLPDRIARLADIAGNVSWSWNREARALFRRVDEHLWVRCRYDPIALLRAAGPDRLARCASDAHFLGHYDAVVQWFDASASQANTWFGRTHPALAERPVAYFCAEFGFYHSVPIYSGGLGVLAGDHCKAASDLGVPLVGVGILYRGGYFDQRIRADGWQEESDVAADLGAMPLEPVVGRDGALHVATVPMHGREVCVRAWRLRAGRVPVYLLDTDLEANAPEDRSLLSNLYPGGPERRLHQEWLLGVGGVRVLRALGVHPVAWHANEGHAAFMYLERLRELIAEGLSWADAVDVIRNTSVFTTHTPVPAGHDVFGSTDVAACAGDLWRIPGASETDFLQLGRHPEQDGGAFHMTVAAIRLSGRVNGVSAMHGAVTRTIWAPLWPGVAVDDVPVGHVTNGVHMNTWLAFGLDQLIENAVGGDAVVRASNPAVWDAVDDIDDAELWAVHQQLKYALLRMAREEARAIFAGRSREAAQLVGTGVLLDPNALTLGFARRFATYKRASMLFTDVDRLLRLVTDPARPVQIVFAGKAHPADDGGKRLLQEVYYATHDPRFEGRVAFIEDYDLHIAHVLVQGVDAWLNTPRVPLEASGTSGMKAALNGVPHISTLDGWWAEGFNGSNGWTIPTPAHEADDGSSDREAAGHLYDLLEREVVPTFYERDAAGLPRRWIAMMKAAMRVGGARFTAHRMLLDYVRDYYVPAARGEAASGAAPAAPRG